MRVFCRGDAGVATTVKVRRRRRPYRKHLRSDILVSRMISLGIDIGGSSVKLALVDGAGQTAWQTQSEPYAQPTRQQLADSIRAAIAGRFDARGAAVGVCVPGTRGRGSHTVLQSINLPALNGLNLDELVRQ